ncbi:MAG: AAA family ATPase [Candidatus Acidiferrum sp.]
MGTVERSPRVAAMAVCLDQTSFEALSHFVAGVPGAVIIGNLDHYAGVEREVGRALDLAHTRICFIDYDRNTEEAVWVTERLRSEYPDVHTFAVSAFSEPEAIIAAMRAGCAEYLLKPVQHERVLDGLARVESKQKKKARSTVRGKVVTLVGAKGGTGVTSLALHLALELAQAKRKCLLVDQHPALGDASLYLGTGRHQYSFYELASNADHLDEELLRGFLLHHNSGLDLLDSPEAVDMIHGASPSTVEHTLAFLAETYHFVIVDCPPGLTDGTRACISQSEQVAIVMTAELPSVRNTVRYIEHLSKLGYSSSSIHVVLNRHSKKGPLSDDRIERALGRAISLRVPNSYNEVIRAINSGAPISSGSKSDFGAAIQRWAHELASSDESNKNRALAAPQTAFGMKALFGR